jgi:cell division protein ZapA
VSESVPVSVNILDREFLVSCTPEERSGLVAAAAHVDGKMREIRNAARSLAVDRIAVMAALNIAHELVQLRSRADGDNTAVAQHLQVLRAKLDGALATPVK